MNDYNELNKIKINLARELDRLSTSVEKLESYICDIENGNGEFALWNGESAYSSVEKIIFQIEKYKHLSEKVYGCFNYLSSIDNDEII